MSDLSIEIGNYPYIKGTDSDELLIISTNNCGMFIGILDDLDRIGREG